MTPLCELAAKYGTDKLRHGYTEFYHRLFEPLREKPIVLVELGILHGASIRMWLDYFPSSAIVAVDNNASRLRAVAGFCRAIPADCGDPEQLRKLPDSIDILIDDASHKPEDQIVAFETLWPRITVGGYYVVEDLHAGWAWEHERHRFVQYIAEMIQQEIHRKPRDLGTYPYVHFYRNLVAIRKT